MTGQERSLGPLYHEVLIRQVYYLLNYLLSLLGITPDSKHTLMEIDSAW